jgi:hypothetical protein
MPPSPCTAAPAALPINDLSIDETVERERVATFALSFESRDGCGYLRCVPVSGNAACETGDACACVLFAIAMSSGFDSIQLSA